MLTVTNIQRFSLHDGPGIRTTIFLKGCSLHCPWCSNPENILATPQKYIKDGKEGVFGKKYSWEELYDEIIKDKAFYDGDWNSDDLEKMPGGVTFSGGECLLQMGELEPLLERLNRERIHTTVETSLFAPVSQLSIAIKYIDLFYVDIKILDDNICRNVLQGDLKLYYSNLELLISKGKPFVFRVPVIGDYTDGAENKKKVTELINGTKGNLLKVEIIKGHNLGAKKYKALLEAGEIQGVPLFHELNDRQLEEYKEQIFKVPVEICRI